MLKEIKKIGRFFDRKIFGGRLKKVYHRFNFAKSEKREEQKNAEQQYNERSLHNRRYDKNGNPYELLATRELSVRDIFLAQYYHDDYATYMHCDGAVRTLALEEFLAGEGKRMFDLYRRMQLPSGFDWTERYKGLITEWKKHGYDSTHHLELDHAFQIMDGSHRVNLALHDGVEFMMADIYNSDRWRGFSIDAFWKMGFAAEECKLVAEKTQKMLDDALYDFIGVLWPPAYSLFDDIISDLKVYDPENVIVSDVFDYELERGDFVHLFKALYHTDILSDEGCNDKIKLIESRMINASDNSFYGGGYFIRVFKLRIHQPRLGINPKNFSTQAKEVKKIKTIFRERFAPKVRDYQYDVIMHISDNYLQSVFCARLFEINRDISEFFMQIKDIPYMVIRAKDSRQHSEFPRKFYFRGNSDVITDTSESLHALADIAHEFAKQHFMGKWISIKRVAADDGVKIIVFLRDFMLYQFEIATDIFGLDSSFRDECLSHTIDGGGYNILPPEDEIIIRLLEYVHKPHKKWYEPYIKDNLEKLDKVRLFSHIKEEQVSREKVEALVAKMEAEK